MPPPIPGSLAARRADRVVGFIWGIRARVMVEASVVVGVAMVATLFFVTREAFVVDNGHGGIEWLPARRTAPLESLSGGGEGRRIFAPSDLFVARFQL